MKLPILNRKLLHSAVSLASVFLALTLIKRSAERGWVSVLASLSGCLTLAWIVMAGENWWILMPFSVAFGGTFFFVYKFYPNEIALIICVMALLPVIALHRRTFPNRPSLTWSVYGLLALFVFNWIVSCYVADNPTIGNLGSISRAYMHGCWALLFGMLFYWHGLLKPRFLLGLLYAAYLARILLAGVAYLIEGFFVVPKVGFAFLSATSGVLDLRGTGIQLSLVAFAFANLTTHNFWKIIHYGIMVMAGILVALGGGRVSIVMICCIPLIWCLIRRKIGMLAVASILMLGMVTFLNQNPYVLYKLPPTARRALSILVAETSTKWVDWHTFTQGSNYWHRYLAELGWQRWTENPLTLILGNRVGPFDEVFSAFSASVEMKAAIASRLGYFESGLWNVLVLLGALGAFFYFRIFKFLLGQPYTLLKKEGIRSEAHALGFIAVILTALWLLFSWTAGGFPSYELMMALFAKVAYSDEMSRRASLLEDSLTTQATTTN